MSRLRLALAVALVVALAVLAGCTGQGPSRQQPRYGAASTAPSSPPARICGSPVLNSPWNYDGAAGSYTSGTPGLPTFGSAGTNFPNATAGLVIAAGNNTTAANSGSWQLNNTVLYFEPGSHVIQDVFFAGNNSDMVGGYAAGLGGAVIDGVNGSGTSGNPLVAEKATSGNNVYNTWEYLTIQNYAAPQNGAVLGNVNGGGESIGDTYKYDTIGPNLYGHNFGGGAALYGQSSGGGYGIDGGSYTTIEYDCLTQDAQGAFNISNAVDPVAANNEISWNGLGTYPDDAGTGESPFSCGCSGGFKEFFTVNADVVNNWVHDNYNIGIWFDFNNTGALISHNYVASNWAVGIDWEGNYNADIAANTLTGNGWDSDGPWPAGVGGGTCFGGISCTGGYGPTTGAGGGIPYGAISLSNSGGDSSIGTVSIPSGITVPHCASSCTVASRYPGHIYITGNKMVNNFGGIYLYTDTNRYPGNIDNDSACSTPFGSLNQLNNTTYFRQTEWLVTNGGSTGSGDAAITGSSVTSTGGTETLCGGYGTTSGADAGQQIVTTEPNVGMGVWDVSTGRYLGDVATVTSANAFTLNDAPGNETGATLLVSAYGGCGPADYPATGTGAPGVISGTPPANYWDHCIWGTRNITVTGNYDSIDASVVDGCNTTNKCGFNVIDAFLAGVPFLVQYFQTMPAYVADATGGLGNVWSDNTYVWQGGGPGGWEFWAGDQGNQVTQSQWQAPPYGQDAGSTFR